MAEVKNVVSTEENVKTIKKLRTERIVTISVLSILVLGIIAALTFKSIVGVWWVEVQTNSTTEGAYIYFSGDGTYKTFMYGVDDWAEEGTYETKGTSISGYIIFKPESGNQYARKYNIRGSRLKIFDTDDTFITFLRNKSN
jgi:hypothetical protein